MKTKIVNKYGHDHVIVDWANSSSSEMAYAAERLAEYFMQYCGGGYYFKVPDAQEKMGLTQFVYTHPALVNPVPVPGLATISLVLDATLELSPERASVTTVADGDIMNILIAGATASDVKAATTMLLSLWDKTYPFSGKLWYPGDWTKHPVLKELATRLDEVQELGR